MSAMSKADTPLMAGMGGKRTLAASIFLQRNDVTHDYRVVLA